MVVDKVGNMAVRFAMNTGTFTLQSVDFLRLVQAISRAGFTGIDLRDNHIQEYVQKGHSIQEMRNLLKEYQLHPVAINSLRDWQNWGNKKEEEYRAFIEQYFNESKGIGCDCVICCAFAEEGDRERDIRYFKEICTIAKSYDIRIALEFLPWAELRDIKMAWEVVRKANCSNGGILVDSFHFFKGGSKIDDLREIPTEKIFLVHLDDAPDLPIHAKEMCMNHRVFPGEGIFAFDQILNVLISEKGYLDWVSLEVLNKDNQRVDYGELAKKGRNSLEKLFRYTGL